MNYNTIMNLTIFTSNIIQFEGCTCDMKPKPITHSYDVVYLVNPKSAALNILQTGTIYINHENNLITRVGPIEA